MLHAHYSASPGTNLPSDTSIALRMAQVLHQLLPSTLEQVTALQSKGFRHAEIERLLPQAVALAHDLGKHEVA